MCFLIKMFWCGCGCDGAILQKVCIEAYCYRNDLPIRNGCTASRYKEEMTTSKCPDCEAEATRSESSESEPATDSYDDKLFEMHEKTTRRSPIKRAREPRCELLLRALGLDKTIVEQKYS